MTHYLLAYQGGSQPASEEEGKAVMDAWIAWFNELGAAVVDGGAPFGPSASIASDGAVSIGGPSALTGYSVITADSLDAAVALAKGCPQLAANGSVDVYEAIDVM